MRRTFAHRLLTVLVLALMVGAVVGARMMTRSEPVRFTAMFESTIGLYPGSDVQVLGVPIGRVTAVDPAGSHVRVTMELDPGQHVAADTGAVIIAPTLVSDRFVQLTHPWVAGEDTARLRTGARLDQDRTAVPIEIDDLYAGITDMSEALGPRGANRNGALSDLIQVGAANLDGQGEEINTMFREFGQASATLSDVDEDFFGTIANLDRLNTMLLANDAAVGQVNRQFAEVAGYLAQDRDDLGLAARNLGGAMAVLDDFIRSNRRHLRRSVENLVPVAKTLRKQRASIDETIRTVPILLHNFLDSYDPEHNLVLGRGNLNEVTLWSTVDGLSAQTSDAAPPTLLPPVGAPAAPRPSKGARR